MKHFLSRILVKCTSRTWVKLNGLLTEPRVTSFKVEKLFCFEVLGFCKDLKKSDEKDEE